MSSAAVQPDGKPAAAEEVWRVLVVDDDDVDRMATRRILGKLPFSIELVEAVTVAEARETVLNERFDCLLLDYRLPDGTGLDVLCALRERSPVRGAVVMLTGEGDEQLAARSIRSGADDYLPKNSLSPASLRRSIDNAMEKCRLRVDLEAEREKRRKSNQELEEFAYAISHDLQEPLRAVSSFLEILQKKYGGSLDDKADQYIDFAVSGASRMQSMIVGILELSRIGRDHREPEHVDLNAIVDAALANLQARIQQSGAIVSVEQLPTLAANGPRLTQLFQNLIGNAIKYHGEEHPRISVTAERLPPGGPDADSHNDVSEKQSTWQFCITDNGIGMDPRFHDRAFAIFQRLHNRNRYEGTGIGLSLCKRIVEDQGGRIWFESAPGSGTRFFFTLPGEERETL